MLLSQENKINQYQVLNCERSFRKLCNARKKIKPNDFGLFYDEASNLFCSLIAVAICVTKKLKNFIMHIYIT